MVSTRVVGSPIAQYSRRPNIEGKVTPNIYVGEMTKYCTNLFMIETPDDLYTSVFAIIVYYYGVHAGGRVPHCLVIASAEY